MAEGGEGRIYSYQGNAVIKIYKNDVNKRDKMEKIKILMSKQLPQNVVAPLELVKDSSGQFIGYMMTRIHGEEFKRLASKKYVISNNITKKEVSHMLKQVKDTLKILHSQHIYVGDLNDLNLLFDKSFQVYFIDTDSWSVDSLHRCTVANDLFKDPKLVNDRFSAGTDDYAFAVLLYKSLTRLHPFGGVIQSNRNMNTLERMEKKMSVFSVNDIIIPPMVDDDAFLSANLQDDVVAIFVDDHRFLIDGTLDDFVDNLKYCDNHGDYYYSRYNKCPVCEVGATEKMKAVKIGTVGGIPIHVILSDPSIKIILNEGTYLDRDEYVVFRGITTRAKYQPNTMYFSSDDGDIFYKVTDGNIKIRWKDNVYRIKKAFKSNVSVLDNIIYYISKSLKLTKFGIFPEGENYEEIITDIAINNIFMVVDDETYFICNMYDNATIVEISGFNYRLDVKSTVTEWGIHHDSISKQWLFIYQDQQGSFYTIIFDKKRGIIYETDEIRYIGKLSNLCFYNEIIYKPSDGKIIGFSYQKNQYKEFEIPVVNAGTKLVKRGKKFVAINEKEIYEIG